MKKVSVSIYIILIFIIIYLLHANFFTWFNLGGVKPNLFVILVLIIGLFAGKKWGIIFGMFLGIAIDFLISKNIGITSIMLCLTGFIGGYLDRNFSKESRITMIMIIIITTLIYEIGIVIFNYFISHAQINMWYVTRTLGIELIYNSIITIIIYPLILKIGHMIEANFKENKIFTRYF